MPRLRYANPRALRQAGCEDLGELAAARRRRFDAEPELRTEIFATMARGESLRRRMRMYRGDGSEYWADVHLCPLEDRLGKSTTWIDIERDVTADVEREELRSDLVSMIAHDLRNPLTSIVGYGELLLQASQTDDQREGLEYILRAARRLESLAGELSTFARLERGDFVAEQSEIDLIPLAREICSYLPSGQRIVLEGLASLVLESDVAAIRHVMENLFSNALKFSARDASVSVQFAFAAGGAEMVVTDRGIGILPDDLPYIFERARRGKNVGSRQGTGLGLSFVKRLVGAIGGTISVRSEAGKGSMFTVSLSLA